MVSWAQQWSTFLRDSVTTSSQTLPFRVFTLTIPTLNVLRCLLDSMQWPDPALMSERGPSQICQTEFCYLTASPNTTSFVKKVTRMLKTKRKHTWSNNLFY